MDTVCMYHALFAFMDASTCCDTWRLFAEIKTSIFRLPSVLHVASLPILSLYPYPSTTMASAHAQNTYLVSAELAVTLAVVAGAVGYGYYSRAQKGKGPGSEAEASTASSTTGKKGKKGSKKATTTASQVSPAATLPQVVSIPGQFGLAEEPVPVKSGAEAEGGAKKAKKNKAKKKDAQDLSTSQASVAAEPSPAPPAPVPAPQPEATAKSPKAKKSKAAKKAAKKEAEGSSGDRDAAASAPEASMAGIDTDGSWTRVERGSKRKGAAAGNETTTTTTTTSTSSPVVERKDLPSEGEREAEKVNKKTLAEKKLGKNRKTGVEEYVSLFSF